MNYSKTLTSFVTSRNLWHRLIEFGEPVKTVEQASRQVDAEKIVKSIVMVDSNGNPILALVPARSMVSPVTRLEAYLHSITSNKSSLTHKSSRMKQSSLEEEMLRSCSKLEPRTLLPSQTLR